MINDVLKFLMKYADDVSPIIGIYVILIIAVLTIINHLFSKNTNNSNSTIKPNYQHIKPNLNNVEINNALQNIEVFENEIQKDIKVALGVVNKFSISSNTFSNTINNLFGQLHDIERKTFSGAIGFEEEQELKSKIRYNLQNIISDMKLELNTELENIKSEKLKSDNRATKPANPKLKKTFPDSQFSKNQKIYTVIIFIICCTAFLIGYNNIPIKGTGIFQDGYGDTYNYEGYFIAGKPYDENGTAIYDDSSSFVGSFKDGKINGFGIYMQKNGIGYKAFWRDGKIISSRYCENGIIEGKDSICYFGYFHKKKYYPLSKDQTH